MAQSTEADHKLCGVGSVKTVHAVDPHDTALVPAMHLSWCIVVQAPAVCAVVCVVAVAVELRLCVEDPELLPICHRRPRPPKKQMAEVRAGEQHGQLFKPRAGVCACVQ